jgi:hypothetical protein
MDIINVTAVASVSANTLFVIENSTAYSVRTVTTSGSGLSLVTPPMMAALS